MVGALLVLSLLSMGGKEKGEGEGNGEEKEGGVRKKGYKSACVGEGLGGHSGVYIPLEPQVSSYILVTALHGCCNYYVRCTLISIL